MVTYSTTILKFASQGEKTGWTYIEVPADVAQELFPGNKKSFRVKGSLDAHKIKQTALLPIGEGAFILPINATIRKKIGKRFGAMLHVQLEIDKTEKPLNALLLECLEDDVTALANFKKMPMSHQKYYSSWIESAKTEPTKAKRIAATINAMLNGMTFGEMMRALKKENTF